MDNNPTTCISIVNIFYSVGPATFTALLILVLTVLGNYPVAKLQHNYQINLKVDMTGGWRLLPRQLQNESIEVVCLGGTFQECYREVEERRNQLVNCTSINKSLLLVLFWSSSIIVSVTTFFTCYLMGILLDVRNVFTFLATVRLVQEPIRLIPDVTAVFIEAKVALTRIVKFLEEPEMQKRNINEMVHGNELEQSVIINSPCISWNENSSKATLASIKVMVGLAEKVAICGGVGSGKLTLIAAILGELPNINGTVSSTAHCFLDNMYWLRDAWIFLEYSF